MTGIHWDWMAVQIQSTVIRSLLALKRAFTQLHSELPLKQPDPLQFVTGSSGFSKSLSKSQIFKQWTYGDDAYFIAKNKSADVIGKTWHWMSFVYTCESHVYLFWFCKDGHFMAKSCAYKYNFFWSFCPFLKVYVHAEKMLQRTEKSYCPTPGQVLA